SLRVNSKCDLWAVKYERCARCKCIAHYWMCMGRRCPELHDPQNARGAYQVTDEDLLYIKDCNEGDKLRLDECTHCFCHGCTKTPCHKCKNPPTRPYKSTTSKTSMKLPPEYDENGNPVFLVIKDARRCKNGRWHMIDSCNSCFCHLHVWFCTDNIHCVPDKNKKPPVDRKCPLGHQFRLGTCHRCYCRPFKLKKYLCNPDIKCNIVSGRCT
ncbi:hypothetical protein B5X24_HaOG202736, partial [Helicoverpa armigera]